MPRRRRWSKRRGVTLPVPDELDLVLGPAGPPWEGVPWDLAVDLAEREWRLHRERILADFRPGARPWAWWVFDQDEVPPAPGDELDRLLEIGELSAQELRVLGRHKTMNGGPA